MGEAAGKKVRLSILQTDGDWWLARDVVLYVRGSQRHINIVVAMTVHERGRMGRDFHFEHADVLVFEGQVMAGLGGDLDFRWSLGGESQG